MATHRQTHVCTATAAVNQLPTNACPLARPPTSRRHPAGHRATCAIDNILDKHISPSRSDLLCTPLLPRRRRPRRRAARHGTGHGAAGAIHCGEVWGHGRHLTAGLPPTPPGPAGELSDCFAGNARELVGCCVECCARSWLEFDKCNTFAFSGLKGPCREHTHTSFITHMQQAPAPLSLSQVECAQLAEFEFFAFSKHKGSHWGETHTQNDKHAPALVQCSPPPPSRRRWSAPSWLSLNTLRSPPPKGRTWTSRVPQVRPGKLCLFVFLRFCCGRSANRWRCPAPPPVPCTRVGGRTPNGNTRHPTPVHPPHPLRGVPGCWLPKTILCQWATCRRCGENPFAADASLQSRGQRQSSNLWLPELESVACLLVPCAGKAQALWGRDLTHDLSRCLEMHT